jgi:hypothetical protein
MTLDEAIAALRARTSQTVPFAGDALGDLQRGASYAAAKAGTLGVPVFWSGGKLRTASIDIARRLGVEDAVTAPATTNQPSETTAPVAVPVIPLATPKSAPAKSRKASLVKTKAARRTRSAIAAE